MLGVASRYALAPHLKAGALHVSTHQGDDFRFVQAELERNSVKRRAIFPGHLDHAVEGGEINLWRLHVDDDNVKSVGGYTVVVGALHAK